jgi:hypothetical protein
MIEVKTENDTLTPVASKPIHAKPNLYSFYFEIIKEIGLRYGYNIIVHGSINRDLDLIAIPWVEVVGDKEKMVDEIVDVISGILSIQNRSIEDTVGTRYGLKPHGRIVYIININRDVEYKYNIIAEIKEYADPQYYIDLSVITSSL